jgi:hypothetical protein
VDEVERARDVLERERAAVLADLAEAGAEARTMAERQRAWKERVDGLLERGRSAGVPVTAMARALGVSRQWTSHLVAQRDRLRNLEKQFGLAPDTSWKRPKAGDS